MINKFNKNFITKMLFVKEGFLILKLPDRSIISIGNQNSDLSAELDIHSWKVFNKLATQGALGFAEAYINNETSSTDIAKVIQLFSLNRILKE